MIVMAFDIEEFKTQLKEHNKKFLSDRMSYCGEAAISHVIHYALAPFGPFHKETMPDEYDFAVNEFVPAHIVKCRRCKALYDATISGAVEFYTNIERGAHDIMQGRNES